MVEFLYGKKFIKQVKKLDSQTKNKVKKQIEKIINNADIGKPLRYTSRGERTVYIGHFRIIYSFNSEQVIFLRCEHRKKVYKRKR